MMAVVVDAYFMTMTAKERVKSISLSAPIFDLDSVRFSKRQAGSYRFIQLVL
jgi:hypothetical protein